MRTRALVVGASVAAVVVVGTGVAVAVNVGGDAGGCPTAFVRAKQLGIEFLDEDVTPSRELTDDPRASDPVFSPDGSQVGFISGRGYHDSPGQSVYVVDVDGSHPRRLTERHLDMEPVWSPDGSRIAFRRGPLDESQLMVVDLDSGRETAIVQASELSGTATPTWLSDVTWMSGDTLSFLGTPNGGGDLGTLYEVSADGGEPTTVLSGVRFGIAWNPDRTAVARRTSPGLRQGLEVVNLATGEVTPVPESITAFSTVLTWSTDDNLLFERNVRGPGTVMVASRGGTATPVVLATITEHERPPRSDDPTCEP